MRLPVPMPFAWVAQQPQKQRDRAAGHQKTVKKSNATYL
jgi:hypothetical protein